jgi:hypothetical protein
MSSPAPGPRKATARDLLFMSTPKLWPTWPYLAVVRYKADGDMDCGVMYDARGVSGKTGYSATVIISNIFFLPPTEDELLALPKETFDTVEELTAAGWRVD